MIHIYNDVQTGERNIALCEDCLMYGLFTGGEFEHVAGPALRCESCDVAAELPGRPELRDQPMSKNHVAIIGDYEYFHGEAGDLFLAHLSYPIDVWGYRQGARFECAPRADRHAKHIANLRAWIAGQPERTRRYDEQMATRRAAKS